MTVDMEFLTLKGLDIFRQDKHSNENTFIPWSRDHKPPSSFLKRLRETQDKPSRDFLHSVVDKNLEPNYRPRHALSIWTSVRLGNNPNRTMVDEETGEQPQIMMVADSNTHDMTSEDTESADSDPIYSD